MTAYPLIMIHHPCCKASWRVRSQRVTARADRGARPVQDGRSSSRAEDQLPLRTAAEQVLVRVAGPRQVVLRADQGPQAAPRREVEQFRQLHTTGSVPGD